MGKVYLFVTLENDELMYFVYFTIRIGQVKTCLNDWSLFTAEELKISAMRVYIFYISAAKPQENNPLFLESTTTGQFFLTKVKGFCCLAWN